MCRISMGGGSGGVSKPRRRGGKTTMKRAFLVWALGWLGLVLLAWPAVVEANDMQRFFRFHNDLDVPIFPIIQAGQNANCRRVYGKALLRIHGKRPAGRRLGLLKGQTGLVELPVAEAGCGKEGPFYKAARIRGFPVSPEKFDVEIAKYGLQKQTTVELNPPWVS